MAAPDPPWISVEEFLQQEERSETKHMYFAGLVTEREGATVEHAMLAMNLCGELYLALRGREYVVLGSDVLLETGSQEMLTYPDLMVFCEPAKLKSGKQNIVTNPTLVVEVLSPPHRSP